MFWLKYLTTDYFVIPDSSVPTLHLHRDKYKAICIHDIVSRWILSTENVMESIVCLPLDGLRRLAAAHGEGIAETCPHNDMAGMRHVARRRDYQQRLQTLQEHQR